MAGEAGDRPPWRVFISYDRRNESVARQLYKRLRADGFDVWWDQWSIRFGASWPNELTKAIQNAQFFIACVSAEYCRKLRQAQKGAPGVLRQELDAALKMQNDVGLQPELHLLIPLRLDERKPPPELARLQYLDWAEGAGYTQLVEEMRRKIADREMVKISVSTPSLPLPSPSLSKAPPLTRILFADTKGMLNGDRLPLVEEDNPRLSDIINLRNWTWRRSAMGRWGAANWEQAKARLDGERTAS